MKEEDKIRQEVLERDNDRCRYCGTTENLEVHHCISKEEQTCHEEAGLEIFPDQIQSEKADQTLRKKMDQPKYRITLCREHHELTFLGNAVRHRAFYTDEEREEQKKIAKKVKELSECHKELKLSWSSELSKSDKEQYQDKKQQIKDRLRSLDNRKMEIKEHAKCREKESLTELQAIRAIEDEQLLASIKPKLESWRYFGVKLKRTGCHQTLL